MRVVVSSLMVMSMLVPSVASSQNCVEPPFTERYEFAGSLTEVGNGVDCRLETRLSGVANGAATVHTVRRDVHEPLRLGFRVDLSSLTGLNTVQSVSLASAVSKATVDGSPIAVADLFRVYVYGNPIGNLRLLGVSAACGSCTPLPLALASVPITTDELLIRVELDIGVGAKGQVRVWVNPEPDSPTTLLLQNLDNAAWIGAERISVGLSSPSSAFLDGFANVPVAFNQIGIADTQYFYSGFEAEGPVCEGLPIPVHAMVNGNTCGGSNLTPTIASGSTQAWSTEAIYTLALPEDATGHVVSIDSQTPGMSAFVCRDFCGPAALCLGAATPGAPFPADELPAGDYRVIVKQTGTSGACGAFNLMVEGPLD